MSTNKMSEQLYCAKYTLIIDDRKVDNCAFISASSAAEAWDLTEALASFWKTEKKEFDSIFRIQRIFKQPCSKNPVLIWSRKIFERIKKKGGFAKLLDDQAGFH